MCSLFSSRRRHTILQGDWSSDVCSSDLRRKSRGLANSLYAARGAARGKAQLLRHTRFRHEANRNRLTMERSEEHTSELQSPCNLVCRLLLEKTKKRRSHSEPHGPSHTTR